MGLNSKKLMKHYAVLVHWHDGLVSAAACWRAKELGFELTDEERQQMIIAGQKVREAKEIVSTVYSKRIGECVTYEIRNGGLK